MSLAKQVIGGISFHLSISMAILVFAILFLLCLVKLQLKKKTNTTPLTKNAMEIIGLTLLFGLTFLSISFIGGDYVYIRYIYMIIPLLYVIVFAVLDNFSYGIEQLQAIVLSLIVVFSLTNAGILVAKESLSYLYIEEAENERKLSENCSSMPLIVLGNEEKHSTAVPTGNFTAISSFDRVYLSSVSEAENNDILKKTLLENNSAVVYIGTNSYWLDGLEPEKVFERLSY